MRTMRMEREDIENSLKVLSHIVDDDFIITVDEARKIIRIDGETIEVLQAQVKRLEEANDELREAQTYIDRYGDEWMTSAKDVPTAAYEHGYFDGNNHAEQKLEPPGGGSMSEWISVKDRLPETTEDVLVYRGKDHVITQDCCIHGTWLLTHVTHWMPLPEPPQEVQE